MQILEEEDPTVPDTIAHKFYCGKETTDDEEMQTDAEKFYSTFRTGNEPAPEMTEDELRRTQLTMTYAQAREAAMNQ